MIFLQKLQPSDFNLIGGASKKLGCSVCEVLVRAAIWARQRSPPRDSGKWKFATDYAMSSTIAGFLPSWVRDFCRQTLSAQDATRFAGGIESVRNVRQRFPPIKKTPFPTLDTPSVILPRRLGVLLPQKKDVHGNVYKKVNTKHPRLSVRVFCIYII